MVICKWISQRIVIYPVVSVWVTMYSVTVSIHYRLTRRVACVRATVRATVHNQQVMAMLSELPPPVLAA